MAVAVTTVHGSLVTPYLAPTLAWQEDGAAVRAAVAATAAVAFGGSDTEGKGHYRREGGGEGGKGGSLGEGGWAGGEGAAAGLVAAILAAAAAAALPSSALGVAPPPPPKGTCCGLVGKSGARR